MDARPVDCENSEYPQALKALAHPPARLWCAGRVPVGRAVAIVGTRRPEPEAVAFATTLARKLAEAGLVIWSGGALGIDAAAHRGALQGDGATVVVLGGGHGHLYPAENASLFGQAAQTGAVLSLVERNVAPRASLFIQRNAILAGATELTVVVQADFKSGARSTAAVARKLGRPLGIVPWTPWDEVGRGGMAELGYDGSFVVRGVSDILARMGLGGGRSPKRASSGRPRPRPVGLSPEDEQLLAALGRSGQSLDGLCERLGRTAASVSVAILQLAVRGLVVEHPSGCYRRSPQCPTHVSEPLNDDCGNDDRSNGRRRRPGRN